MMIEWIAAPSICAGLVVLGWVPGIDKLVFIAMLAEKPPPALRDRARITGLTLAMGMRPSLLLALEQLRSAQTHFAFVAEESGAVERLVTLSDVMETIASRLPNGSEASDPRHDIQQHGDASRSVHGQMAPDDLMMSLLTQLQEKRDYHMLAGLLMEH